MFRLKVACTLTAPDSFKPAGFVNFDTPVAGLNAQRQVHFPHRPSSVVGQQDAQEAQPKRTFTTLRKPLGQPKGIVGKTLSIHQQILPTGFKPVNRSALPSFSSVFHSEPLWQQVPGLIDDSQIRS